MLRFCIYILLLFLIQNMVFANASQSASTKKINHVIYITLDGIRWQDVFLDHSHLKKFWERHAAKGIFYGMPNTSSTMEVASIPISLPSYQSQMSGKVQTCRGNWCGRIRVETFPEILKNKLNLEKKDVAVFGSWFEISYAAEHIAGSIFTNSGNSPVYDPSTQRPDQVMHELNLKQVFDHPFGINRYDKYTFAQALHYFETYKPRFIWIALNDADEAAHLGRLDLYHAALSYYDGVLDEIFSKLAVSNSPDEMMVIVTTDHGRGDGDSWTDHGPRFPESKQTWAFVINGNLIPVSQESNILHFSTLSIRPSVEKAMGL